MRSPLQKIAAILSPAELRAASVLFVMMLLGMVCETLGVGLIVPVLSLITDPGMTTKVPAIADLVGHLGIDDTASLIAVAMLALVAVYALRTSFLALLAWKQAQFTFGIEASLSSRLFNGYLRQAYTFHMQNNSARLIRNVTGEISQFTTALTSAAILLSELLVMAGIGGLLIWREPLGALVVFLALGLAGGIFYGSIRRWLLKWGAARQFHEARRLQQLQQGLGGIKEVKIAGREQEFVDVYALHMNQSSRIGRTQSVLQAMPRLWLELMAVTGLAVLVISMLLQGQPVAGLVPTLGLFAAAAFRLMPSVNRILNALQTLRFNLPVVETLYAEREFLGGSGKRAIAAPMSFAERLELRDLHFGYPGVQRPAVNAVNLTVRKGAVVGFIGGSGAGKSTIIDLILGLLSPQRGAIAVDDVDIRDNLRGWQDRIGYVPQTIFLTDDTIRNNIAFGVLEHEIDDAAVTMALAAAQLSDFIATLPDGQETLVGERGVRLSGGQRQRIGIARALYHNPDLLVLDEATSALDTETERQVMSSVFALKGQKTVLIVAHRLSTVEGCDCIFRIENGCVVASGSPEAVLAPLLSAPEYSIK